jgi:transmembrane sensor
MNRQILDEASNWFVDFRVGDVDAGSRKRFDEWLRQSPEHIRAYMEIAKTYVELPAIKSVADVDVEALIASARADTSVLQLRQAVPVQAAAPARRPVVGTWALAASLALIVVTSALAWLWQHRYPAYATEIGENRSITLADGSTVNLNARSEIRIEFSKAERAVELVHGQALFEVAKNAARPFIVKSGAARVRAVGTQFDVNRAQGGTTVTVIEGRVAVLSEGQGAFPSTKLSASQDAAPGSAIAVTARGAGPAVAAPIYVSAGEQVTVNASRVSPPKRANVAAATAWTEHRLIFDNTPLVDVVENFNRYNARQLILENAELNDFHVSGVYASTDPASLIRFLQAQPGMEVIETDNAVRIHRK